MRHVSADCLWPLIDLTRTDNLLALPRRVLCGLANVVDDCHALVVAGRPSGDNRSGHLAEAIGFAIPTWQQKRQRFLRQLMYLNKGSPSSRIGVVRGFDIDRRVDGE